jgi:ATP-dependent Lhr-like helicase
MREVLVQEGHDQGWSQRARSLIDELRGEHAFLRDAADDGPAPMVDEGNEAITWWTFAGGSANLLLARMIEAELGGKCVSRNTSITCKEAAGKSLGALGELCDKLAAEQRPDNADARRCADSATGRGRVSKFVPCLPEEALTAYLAERMMDVEGARAVVRARTRSSS